MTFEYDQLTVVLVASWCSYVFANVDYDLWRGDRRFIASLHWMCCWFAEGLDVPLEVVEALALLMMLFSMERHMSNLMFLWGFMIMFFLIMVAVYLGSLALLLLTLMLRGIMDGHWFDLQAAWATAAGSDPAPTREQVFGAANGSKRDFFLGCLLASAALGWCRVLEDRWILPHHSLRASFCLGWWSTRCCQALRYSVVWPAAWVSAVGKTRNSKSAEGRRTWEVYDDCLQVVYAHFWDGIRGALLAGDVSLAWSVWSFVAETSLVRAFLAAGGTLPTSGVRFGRGLARFKTVTLGGPLVGKIRFDISGSEDGQSVHL